MKKLFSTFLIFTFLFFLFANPLAASDDYWQAKIRDNVFDVNSNESEEKLIIIWRDEFTDKDIENAFIDKHGYSTKKYENEDIYKMTVVPEVTERVNAKYGKVYADNANIGQKAFNDNTTFLQQEIIKEVNEFNLNKRHVISDMYRGDIDSFVARNRIDETAIIYKGFYTGSIIMYATNSKIKELAKDESVIEISLWENRETFNTMDNSNDIIDSDNTNGTKSYRYNSGTGYKGSEIKIGIIESNGRYNSNAKQLEGISSSRLKYVDNIYPNNTIVDYEITDHATHVTSIIVGQAYSHNSKIYEGVVPNATVYQTSARTENDGLNAIYMLANTYGVSVINYSVGTSTGTGYDGFDKEVDRMCQQTNILLVTTAGNRTSSNSNNNYHPYDYITSPGKAYNVITVGKAYTKHSDGEYLSPNYTMVNNSCFYEATHLTNKPDIAAPGQNIRTINASGTEYIASGTSFAAPMVTGVVAQLHQANPSLIGNPTATKALILAGADPTVISTSNGNTTVDANNLIFEKSGVGMLNAVYSIDASRAYNYGSVSLNLNGISNSLVHNLGSQYIKAGETIRIALTFNKPETSKLTSTYGNNVNLKLFATGAITVAQSSSTNNNVEILEYTPTTSGEYYIVCDIPTSISVSDDMYLNISAAWRIIHEHDYTDSYIGTYGDTHVAFCYCGVMIRDDHKFTHSYELINTNYHYCYCVCGMKISEGHAYVTGPFCIKCRYPYLY